MVLELLAVLSFCGFCHLVFLKALPDRPQPRQMAWFHPIIVSGGCLSTIHSSPVLMLSGTQVAFLWRGCFLLVFSSVLIQHSPPQPMGQALPAPSPPPTAFAPHIHPVSLVLVLRAVDSLPVSHLLLVTLHGCKSPRPRTPLHFSHLNPYDVHDCTPLQPGITLACNIACTGDPSPGLPVCSPHPLSSSLLYILQAQVCSILLLF